jgi:hypothetical protein
MPEIENVSEIIKMRVEDGKIRVESEKKCGRRVYKKGESKEFWSRTSECPRKEIVMVRAWSTR